jgi:hypothetical protein
MVDGYFNVWESSQTQKDVKVLTATPNKFVSYFLKINLVYVSSTPLLDNLAIGNSRDTPERFLFRCQNDHCERTFNSLSRKQQHEVNCNNKPVSADLILAEYIQSNCLE